MKILISCNNFSYLSGAPMYVFTLAKELKVLGNDITIYSKYIGGVITEKSLELGIKVINQLDYKDKFDVMHLCQKWSEHLLYIYDCPAVYTIHSEFACEEPIRSEKIKRYIAIRPSIAERWGIDCEIIYNPIDFDRFHPYCFNCKKEGKNIMYGIHYCSEHLPNEKDSRKNAMKPKKEMTLFVGTIDNLRMKSAMHLIECGKNVRFVGQKFANWANNIKNYFPDTWYIEEHLKEATETAGIMLGRTTLEGYACGIPSIIYDIDEQGNIKSITRNEPPKDMSPFDSKLVAKQIEKIYESVRKI